MYNNIIELLSQCCFLMAHQVSYDTHTTDTSTQVLECVCVCV